MILKQWWTILTLSRHISHAIVAVMTPRHPVRLPVIMVRHHHSRGSLGEHILAEGSTTWGVQSGGPKEWP